MHCNKSVTGLFNLSLLESHTSKEINRHNLVHFTLREFLYLYVYT